ncbi:hypothetical protein [Nitrobacter sp.]|uniref:hypothetical protein n=1 Tax=Nitrobacter sp. TaxID=29420 RepID=UPI0029CAB115|nr:hypothetical protein [Nitrobacter sp.]
MKENIGYLLALRHYLAGIEENGEITIGASDAYICAEALGQWAAAVGRRKLARAASVVLVIGLGTAGVAAGAVLARLV